MFLNLKVYSIGIILRDVQLYAIGIRKKYLKLIDLWNAFVLIKECIRKEIQSIKLVLRKEPRECLSGLLISKLMTIKKHNRISFFLLNIALLTETQEHLQIMSESVLLKTNKIARARRANAILTKINRCLYIQHCTRKII